MTVLDFGWTLIFILWIFLAGFIAWVVWICRRLDRLHEKVREMNRTVEDMNRILDEDEHKLDSLWK